MAAFKEGHFFMQVIQLVNSSHLISFCFLPFFFCHCILSAVNLKVPPNKTLLTSLQSLEHLKQPLQKQKQHTARLAGKEKGRV